MATEIRGLHPNELEAHAALVYQSYYEYVVSGERTFLGDPHWWLKGVTADPFYQPELTRVLFLDGRMVASVTIYDRWVYVADGRRARVGSIGSVCTHPDFRRRGLVKQVLEEAIAWMQAQGFHWSSLFGREEVYNGSGWTLLSSFTCTADLLPASPEKSCRHPPDAGRRSGGEGGRDRVAGEYLAKLHKRRSSTGHRA